MNYFILRKVNTEQNIFLNLIKAGICQVNSNTDVNEL